MDLILRKVRINDKLVDIGILNKMIVNVQSDLPDKGTHEDVNLLVKRIIENKKKNLSYDYTEEQKSIDSIVFEFYTRRFNLSQNLRKNLDENYAIYK